MISHGWLIVFLFKQVRLFHAPFCGSCLWLLALGGLHRSDLLCALSGNLMVTVFSLFLPVLALALF